MKANLPKREPEMLKHWDETNLYGRLMEARKDAQLWVLHDGPPYANGRVHLGTALDDGISHTVCAGMGLSRDADRAQGIARARRQGAHDSQARAAQAVPRRS